MKNKSFITFWEKGKAYKYFYLIAIIIAVVYYAMQANYVEKAYDSGKYVQQTVDLSRFEMVSCVDVTDMSFNTTDENGALIYTGNIDSIYINYYYSRGLSDFIVYYNDTADYEFSEENKMVYKFFNEYFIYDFPNDTKQIKLVYPNCSIKMNEILLNCRDHTNKYNFSASGLFTVAVAPTVVYLLADFVIHAFRKFFGIKRK